MPDTSAPQDQGASAHAPITGAWWVVDHNDHDSPIVGPYKQEETAAYARSVLEQDASHFQSERWNLWVVFVADAARGIECASTTTEGRGPKGEEPGAEGTRPEAVSPQPATPTVEQINQELFEALRNLYYAAPTSTDCSSFHHGASERHRFGEPCPVAADYLEALAKARAAIARATSGASNV